MRPWWRRLKYRAAYGVGPLTPNRLHARHTPRLQAMPLESIIARYARKFGSGREVVDG